MKEQIENFKIIYNRVDKKMFYGSKSLYTGNLYGKNYIVLTITVNAIYFENVQPFLTLFGLTEEKIKEYERKEYEENLERERKYQESIKEDGRKKQLAYEKVSRDITYLTKNFEKKEKTKELGLYVKPYYSMSNEKVTFQLIKVSKTGRQRIPRISRNIYNTLKEALSAKEVSSSFSTKLSGTIKKVYKIK